MEPLLEYHLTTVEVVETVETIETVEKGNTNDSLELGQIQLGCSFETFETVMKVNIVELSWVH